MESAMRHKCHSMKSSVLPLNKRRRVPWTIKQWAKLNKMEFWKGVYYGYDLIYYDYEQDHYDRNIFNSKYSLQDIQKGASSFVNKYECVMFECPIRHLRGTTWSWRLSRDTSGDNCRFVLISSSLLNIVLSHSGFHLLKPICSLMV